MVTKKPVSENCVIQVDMSDGDRSSIIEMFMKTHFNSPSIEHVETLRKQYEKMGLPEDIISMHLLYHGAINQTIHMALEEEIVRQKQAKKNAVRVKKPRK
jgi:hypothetical protein